MEKKANRQSKIIKTDALGSPDPLWYRNSIEIENLLKELKELELTRSKIYEKIERTIEYYSWDGKQTIDETTPLKEKEYIELCNKKLPELKESIELPISIDFDNTRIKLTIEDYLPSIYLTSYFATVYFADRWKREIGKALRRFRKEHDNLQYNKIFAFIRMYNIKKFDCDNRLFKPAIDGLVYGGLIKNDDGEKVKIGLQACFPSDNKFTEVYIYGNDNVPKFLEDII